MKKSWVGALMLSAISLSAAAQDGGSAVAEKGKLLFSASSGRLAAVYRVGADGSAQLILDGKLVTVPANTLSVVDGKLTTSLSRGEVKKLQ